MIHANIILGCSIISAVAYLSEGSLMLRIALVDSAGTVNEWLDGDLLAKRSLGSFSARHTRSVASGDVLNAPTLHKRSEECRTMGGFRFFLDPPRPPPPPLLFGLPLWFSCKVKTIHE